MKVYHWSIRDHTGVVEAESMTEALSKCLSEYSEIIPFFDEEKQNLNVKIKVL